MSATQTRSRSLPAMSITTDQAELVERPTILPYTSDTPRVDIRCLALGPLCDTKIKNSATKSDFNITASNVSRS